jgi:LPXTG-site transpeptidase (sortase) family protein
MRGSMTARRAGGDSPGLDEPIPEVDAALGPAPATRGRGPHAAFLAVVRGVVQSAHHPSTDDARRDPALEEAGPEDTPDDCLPGLSVVAGHRSRAPRGGRRRQGSRTRRATKLAAAVALLGACLAVPWVVPEVPAYLADLVPGHQSAVTVEDPAVAPPTDAFVGPVGISQQAGPYDGARLQAAGPPRQVVVPRLHVDSTVVPISGQSGSLLPPSDPQVLGWWREGQPVGAQEGSAVVTGHTVHTGGGALDHLDRLVVGDSLRVRTDHGWIRYVVQRTRVYSTAQLARDAEQVFRRDGAGRLVLITCDDWNGSSYDSNAVVFATPVDDQPN